MGTKKLLGLSLKDRSVLATWLSAKLTLDDVESLQSTGLVENVRFTERARDVYFVLWTWSADRFHGESGRLQDEYVKRFGLQRLKKRLERCNQLIDGFLKGVSA